MKRQKHSSQPDSSKVLANPGIAEGVDVAFFFAVAHDLFCITDNNGFFKKINPAFTKALGYSEKELLGQQFIDFLHPDDVAITLQQRNQINQGLNIYSFENRYIHKSGEVRWISWSTEIGNDNSIYAIGKDITVQKLSEAALMESEKSYKTLFNNAPIPQWIYDLDTLQFLNVNDAAVAHYGFTMEEFLQMNILDIRPAEIRKKFLKKRDYLNHDNGTANYTTIHHKKDGSKIIADVNSSFIRFNGRNARLVTVNDITEKIRLQEKLTRELIGREKRIAQATIAAQEKEREYIGLELHDNVNQMLASAKLHLEIAQKSEDLKNKMIETSREIINNTIQQIRALSKSLVLPSITDVSMKAALEEVLEPYVITKKFNVQIRVKCKAPLEDMAHDIKLAIIRILQEQLNNITKHAAAKNVWIILGYGTKKIELVVIDDGKGFDVNAKIYGIGLGNIKNRAETYNGTSSVISGPGKGCILLVRIPNKSAN